MLLRLISAVLAVVCPTLLFAGPVELTSLDGTLTVRGDLVSIEGEFYRIETAYGPLTLDGGNLNCRGAGCPDPDTMIAKARIGGPTGMIHRLLPALVEVFAEREGLDLRSVYLGEDHLVWELSDPASGRLLGSFEGFVDLDRDLPVRLASGQFDITIGRSAAEGVRQDVIALDAVVPIVAPANPRAMVTETQLSALLAGRIDNWSVLGGPDLPVDRFVLESAKGDLRRWHRGRIDGETGSDANQIADQVAADPAALGIVTYSTIGNAAPLVVGGSCGLAIPATRDSIRAEDYPLTQPLFLQRIGTRQPKILRDFIAYARSAEAQPVIEAAGYVDQAIGRIGFDRQGGRIANAVLAAGDDAKAAAAVRDMVGALLNRDRLTLTFRFEDGSSDLDAQSASNIRRLADAINQGTFDGSTLYFTGFTDGLGPADGNLRLSQRRAQSVRRAVAAHVENAPVMLDVAAFGEALPMACDDTAWGRQVNRRVEVWIDSTQR